MRAAILPETAERPKALYAAQALIFQGFPSAPKAKPAFSLIFI
jgi:hypothetical protein